MKLLRASFEYTSSKSKQTIKPASILFLHGNREISKDPLDGNLSNNTRSGAALLLRAAKASWRANFYQLIPFRIIQLFNFAAGPLPLPRASHLPPSPHKQKSLVSFFHRSAAYRRDIVERSPWTDEGRKEEEKREETTSILDSKHDATRFPRFSRLTTINGDWPRVT